MANYAERVAAPPARIAAARRQAPSATPRPPLSHVLQLRAAAAMASSRSGLPPQLKAGIEQLSGLAMDDVRIHRNSPAPARIGALAYAQGSDIHLGPGQERHLPHEAWHVVQQKQGRVRATAQLKGAPINDSAALEAEADAMGARAARADAAPAPSLPPVRHSPSTGRAGALQLMTGAVGQQGIEITLAQASSLADAAKQSAIRVNQEARKTGQDQYEASSVLGARFSNNLYIKAPFPNGSLESWLEVTNPVGGGYVKRVRVIENGATTMDRIMDEGNAASEFQQALVTNLAGNHALGGGQKYDSKHEVNQGDADKLKINENSGRAADNLTKIVGEGARFGWLADKLANGKVGNATKNVLKTSVKIQQAGKLEADPTFEQLWGSWDLVFGKKYMKDLGTAKGILNQSINDGIRYAGANDAINNQALASGSTANAAISSLANLAGTAPLIVNKQGGNAMAMVTRLGMKWTAEK